MIAPLLASVGHGYTSLWYLTRATGLVSLILLTTTVVLGIVASVGWTTERWPRFLSQALHRNLSLFCLALIAVHVVTTVADGYVPIGYLDAVLPFRTPYRPLWVGLGALAFDLLLAVAITSGLRRRIGVRVWRGVHWLAYVCWPIALLHGMGSGSDTRLPLVLVIEIGCAAAVAVAIGWRLVISPALTLGRRMAAALAGVVTLLGIGVFAAAGPLAPHWSSRAGTSTDLLAQLNATLQSGGSTASTVPVGEPSSTATPQAPPATSSGGAMPAAPFTSAVQGTYQTSAPNQNDQVQVVLTMHAKGSTTPLVVQLNGTAVGGGVAMSSSQVTWGAASGTVTALEGSSIGATVSGAGRTTDLTMQVNLDQSSGTLAGTVSGVQASPTGAGR